MIYFNNPTFTITILTNLAPKRSAPKSHIPCVQNQYGLARKVWFTVIVIQSW